MKSSREYRRRGLDMIGRKLQGQEGTSQGIRGAEQPPRENDLGSGRCLLGTLAVTTPTPTTLIPTPTESSLERSDGLEGFGAIIGWKDTALGAPLVALVHPCTGSSRPSGTGIWGLGPRSLVGHSMPETVRLGDTGITLRQAGLLWAQVRRAPSRGLCASCESCNK